MSERRIYRLRALKGVKEKKEKFVKESQESLLQKRLKATGISYFNAVRFYVLRWCLILVVIVAYVVAPLLSDDFSLYNIFYPLGLYFLTEPKLKYSLVSIILNSLVANRQKKRVIEVFTLFDLLKADLYTLKSSQQVNVYSILRESLPMFEHIQGSISRILSLWKVSPEKAKNVLYEEIGGETAKILGDILIKLDKSTKDEALKIIEAESNVFSFTYYENELRYTGKQKTVIFTFFTFTSVVIIGWLVFFVFNMFSGYMSNGLL
ncbi:hypothetical protein [Robertmurraya massiliosenegalensis]|uniref:hypothetical protein n=1 Tax=Robertmurraya massiliosenegalensis TaxID=1287657 RepID=UPI0002F9F128|nr:hypothetical protein [Robertmurraya massiliosenegalensis]